MQVIHHYNGIYPFSLEKESDTTYLQVLKQNLTDQEIKQYQKKYRIVKDIDDTNIIKLVKIYKEQSKLHLLYEYLSLSLEQYIHYRSQQYKDHQHEQLKDIYACFQSTLNKIVSVLIDAQIKTDISIENFAVLTLDDFHLKLFIDPDAQIPTQPSSNINQPHKKCSKHQQFLHQFYSTEKKRLILQLQQMLEKYFGKSYTVSSLNKPNFIIDGCKLVFINNADPPKNDRQHRTHQITEVGHKDQQIIFETEPGTSPLKHEKGEKRDLKQKTKKKIEQIKNVLHRLERPNFSHQQNYKHYAQKPDEVIFRNQITTDKTSNEEDNEPEKQLEHSAEEKKKRKDSQEKRANIIKQLNQLQQKNRSQPSQRSSDLKGLQRQRKSLKEVKFLMNHQGTDKESQDVRNTEKLQQKPNKYKMKITTHHQIEIQPQTREHESKSIEDIKSGSASQLPLRSQRPRTYKLQEDEQIEMRVDSNNIRINSRNSDIASKSKKINEIIEKINSKANINPLSNQPQQHKGNEEINDNGEHTTQSYYSKIREAKHKAQQVLKQYAKKKQ